MAFKIRAVHLRRVQTIVRTHVALQQNVVRAVFAPSLQAISMRDVQNQQLNVQQKVAATNQPARKSRR